jgi:amidase
MEEMTIGELQQRMESAEYTAQSIVEMYLARIRGIDKQGPAVNAIIELNPDALSIAEALDEERRERGPRGPLHGIPIILKDNMATADKIATTAGSLALNGSIALQDSFVAEKLRQAGAVILAKANLSEWANFRSTHSTSGWSSRGGQTRNPYALDRNPSGSSSGSAVAVAANFCGAALGTETDGSVVAPSAANSVVGIKPTVGLAGRSGIIPVAHSQDTAGPMARTVEDAAIVLGVITGVDPRDPVTQESQGKSYADYTQFLDLDGMRGARIGVARNFCGFNEKVDRIVDGSVEVMRKLGAEVIDPADITTVVQLREIEFEVLLWEFKAGINDYLSGVEAALPVHSLKELIEFNERNHDRVMPYFGQEILLQAEEKGPLTDEAYLKASEEKLRLSRTEGIDLMLVEHSLDAIVAPTMGPPRLTDLINGDSGYRGSSSPAAAAGYPGITLPAGYVHGLPIGISFFAAAYQEPLLVRLAFAFEQASRIRRPPQFLPTADLSL